MTRRLTIDSFMFNDEFDVLEMRLMELYDVVDDFVLVEADVDHQDHPKPYRFSDYLGQGGQRFDAYLDKITIVKATDLPTAEEFPDAWSREHAQREWIGQGLIAIGVEQDDILMQSDVDEIPRAIVVRSLDPGGELIVIGQRCHFFAVDWFYDEVWKGTVAGTVGAVVMAGHLMPFTRMRDARMTARCPVLDGGWHLSWLGGPDRVAAKVHSFCHPEVSEQICDGIIDGLSFWRDGVHVDGVAMKPVDVDAGWPRFIVEGYAPQSWYRPR
jgi:beta-1,4-mannosyl-glycoprotein beta-1,4-N-acetylglucosaminyltransferase